MRHVLFPTALAGLLLAPPTAGLGTAQPATTAVAGSYYQQVEAIATGETIEDRRAAIIERLDSLGLTHELEWFDAPPRVPGGRRGANILVELAGEAPDLPRLLLGAHYDRVAVGRGALDNASGSAAVLELLEAFLREPLAGLRVSAVFFDLEEVGLLGSAHHVRARQPDGLPDVYINFDVFGYGDALWLMTRTPSRPFALTLGAAAQAAGHPLTASSEYPDSDHESFLATRIDTYSLSLLGHDEIAAMIAEMRGLQDPGQTPRVLQIIHSQKDTVEMIEEAAVARALEVVEDGVRRLGAGPR